VEHAFRGADAPLSFDFHGPIDLLAQAGGIGIIALALYFSHSDVH
jgi:hypothetical protein